MSKMLNVAQTAAYFKVSAQSIHYWIKTGKLKANRVKGSKNRIYISTEEIARYERERERKNKDNKNLATICCVKEEGNVIFDKKKETSRKDEKIVANDFNDFSDGVIELLNNDCKTAIDELAKMLSSIHSRQEVTIPLFHKVINQAYAVEDLIADISDLIYDEFDALC